MRRSRLVLVPDRQTGVVVLANSNTAPTSVIASAALGIALANGLEEGAATLRTLLPPVPVPVADTLATSGREAARAVFHELAAAEPPAFDLDEEGVEAAVWGAIELHRTTMIWPLIELWTDVSPGSSTAWTMAGWAHQVDGQLDLATRLLQRALDLDPDNDDAALIMSNLPSA